MKKAIIILAFAVALFNCNENHQRETKIVSPEEMQTLLQIENVQLVDVRTPNEFKEGHINNAQNIDFLSPTFSEDIKELDKSKPIIVYCKSGGRSAKCSKKLIEAGFEKVYDLQGGFSKWKHKGFEIEF